MHVVRVFVSIIAVVRVTSALNFGLLLLFSFDEFFSFLFRWRKNVNKKVEKSHTQTQNMSGNRRSHTMETEIDLLNDFVSTRHDERREDEESVGPS